MLLRYSFKLETEAACVESSVAAVLAAGSRTKDLAKPGESVLSTFAMGKKIAEAVRERLAACAELEYLETRAARGSRQAFEHVLSKVPPVEPLPGDDR